MFLILMYLAAGVFLLRVIDVLMEVSGSVPISGTFPFWTHKSLCFEPYPAAKIGLYPLQGHHPENRMLHNVIHYGLTTIEPLQVGATHIVPADFTAAFLSSPAANHLFQCD